MFKRRKRRSRLQHLREAIWPSAGWQRTLTYWGHRLIRLQGSPHSIAMGLAFGAAISMTPFLGLHIVLTLLMCWVFGAPTVAGLIGTLVGNPWTFPFIFMFAYRIGSAILGITAAMPASFELSFETLIHSPFEVLAPTLGPLIVGSIPVAITTWWITYLSSKYLIIARRRRRAAKLSARERGVIAGGGAQEG